MKSSSLLVPPEVQSGNGEFSVEGYVARFRPFLNLLEEAVFVVDANSRDILMANQAASRLTGFSPAELESRKIDSLHDPEELPLLLLEIQRLEFERVTSIEEFTLVQKNGWKFPVDVHLARLVQDEEEFKHRYFLAIYRGRPAGEGEDASARRNQELLALMEVGQTIASALDVDELEKVKTHLPAGTRSFWL